MPTPLDGIRVVDLSRVLAGPTCSQALADLGADVIKIERPGTGDDTRTWGPPFLKDRDGKDTTDAAYYLAANRNKRSILADLASPEGQQMVRDLVAEGDVLLENFKVGQLARYGLDYESLSKINPRLVYCSVTGFGQDGPLAKRPGYDFVIQGMGGFMSVTGEADDRPGGGPQKAGVAISDLFTGMVAVQGILAALLHRERTGEGQYIDVALLDVTVHALANMATNYLVSGKPPKRWGNAHPNVVPYQTFQAGDDRWIIVAVGNNEQFRRLCVAGGRPELAEDPLFLTNAQRIKNREALIPLVAEFIRTRSQADWIAELERVGVPCGPINTLDQVFENEQVKARGLRIDIEREDAGPVPGVRSPIRLSKSPVRIDRPPPRLGEHTEEILREVLGYEGEQLAAYLKTVG